MSYQWHLHGYWEQGHRCEQFFGFGETAYEAAHYAIEKHDCLKEATHPKAFDAFHFISGTRYDKKLKKLTSDPMSDDGDGSFCTRDFHGNNKLFGDTLENGATVIESYPHWDGVCLFVLCSYKGQYVVWNYNPLNGGCYQGSYFGADDLAGAVESYNKRRITT